MNPSNEDGVGGTQNPDLDPSREAGGLSSGQIPGKAHDVAVDLFGNRYAVGSQQGSNGYTLYKWPANAPAWQKMNAQAIRVTARPKQAWIVNAKGQVFYENGPVWRAVQAPPVKDIGAGRNEVWIVTQNDQIYRYVPSDHMDYMRNGAEETHRTNDGVWIRVPGDAVRIDLDDSDLPWIVDKRGQLKYFKSGRWMAINGPKAVDVTAVHPKAVQFVDEKGAASEYYLDTRTYRQVRSADQLIGIGGSNGQSLMVNKNLDIFVSR
ncbi:MAG: hypothetical protein HWE34_15525 [Methylocystaceae bacterium]|nr:hypothetical protein [Methylocystaceae bacterium]